MKIARTLAAAALLLVAASSEARAQSFLRAGTSTFASGNTFTITFPVPLPTADYSVSVQPSGTPHGFVTTTNACTYFDVANKTPSGFQVSLRKCHLPGALVNVSNLTFDWTAVIQPCVESPVVAFVNSLSAYTSAVASMTDTVVDFSLDCSGASTHAVYQDVQGNFFEHCDLVTFTSWGVSNQYFPSGSCTPFRGLSNPYVGAVGADHGGPSIGSSAGGLNYTGYDAIEADFTSTMRAAGVAVSALPQGGTLEVFGPDGTVTHSYGLPPDTSPAFYGVVGACIGGIRVTPATLCTLVLNTSAWGMSDIHFAR